MTVKRIGSISIEELIKKNEAEDAAIAKALTKSEKKLEGEELKEAKKENKFYLPVLNINKPEFWEPIPASERKHFTDSVAKETCLSRCCGVDGLKAGCCKLDPNDIEHVLGPLTEDYIQKLVKWFQKKGINFKRQDIVIDFEEGKIIGRNFFNGHPVFEDPKSYPFFRFEVDGPRFSCKFLNNHSGMCSIYEMRPDMCRNYYCSYVKANFLIRSKKNPSKFYMERAPSNEKENNDNED
jgi:Fe-S-cluster containining protein